MHINEAMVINGINLYKMSAKKWPNSQSLVLKHILINADRLFFWSLFQFMILDFSTCAEKHRQIDGQTEEHT